MKASILAILLSQALVAFSLPTQSQHISERSATSPPNPIVWPESAIGYDAIANKFIYKEHENVTTVMYSPANHSNLERRQKFIAAKVKVCKNSGFREPCKIEVLPVHDDVQFRICCKSTPPSKLRVKTRANKLLVVRIDPHKVWNNVISSIEVAKEYYCILFK